MNEFQIFPNPPMRACFALILPAFMLSAVCAQDSVETKKQDTQDWTDVSPGKNLKGWYRVSVPPGKELGRAQWHVDDDGLLICDGDGGHDMLLTEKEYSDVVFSFEFCYTKKEGTKGYNSGAYVRNSRDGSIWHQAQFGDANGGFLFGVTKTTSDEKKFFKKQAASQRVKPAGQWNSAEITAKGTTIRLRINGEITSQFEDCGVEKGHIGLEGEGYRIEFRNLRVQRL